MTTALASLSAELVDAKFLERIPHDFARAHLVVSQGIGDGTHRVAAAETTDPLVIHNVGVRLGATVEPFVADAEEIASVIDTAYETTAPDEGGGRQGTIAVDDDIERLVAQADRDLLSTQGKGPVIRLVDALLFEAVSRGASDVHVQPVEDHTLVRYRRDGVLHTVREIPRKLAPAVISRIKVVARMDIAEPLAPQDGRATVTIGAAADGATGRAIDLRISTL
ncbi:MAG: Flp pilus assembly complex ATPase component, partial [Planctomycetes bacterium]|nr:Flp pilus assembly complex ATPase component [Planctomycetota bacterium]